MQTTDRGGSLICGAADFIWIKRKYSIPLEVERGMLRPLVNGLADLDKIFADGIYYADD